MDPTSALDLVRLRPTAAADLDFVLAAERHPDNAPYVGQWPREQHQEAIANPLREHWVIETPTDGSRIGFLIAYNLVGAGFGVYIKRVVVGPKSRRLGREALRQFADYAADELRASVVWLTVYADNLRAQRAYAAVGFCIADLSAEQRLARHAAVGGFSDHSLVMLRATR